MDKIKSTVNKNLLISFYISLGYLIFIISLFYFFDKEVKPLALSETEYKMLYFVESYDNASKVEKLYDIPYGQTSFISPVGDKVQIPSNTSKITITEDCFFASDKNELIYLPSIGFEPYPSNKLEPIPSLLVPRTIEVFRKPSYRAPYVYDFKSNSYSEIPCVGKFSLDKSDLNRSPDGMVDFYPHSRLTTEEPVGKYSFPFLGQKQRSVSDDYSVGDMLINGKFGSSEELGIVFNPYFTSPGDLWYQVKILGWFK